MGKAGKHYNQKGMKNGASLFSGELGDFSNANADMGFDFEDESSTSETAGSSSASSDSSTDSMTNSDGDHSNEDAENDVIKGLNIVGNGYQMSGTWSPGDVRGSRNLNQNPPKLSIEATPSDFLNMSSFCNSSVDLGRAVRGSVCDCGFRSHFFVVV